MNNNKIKLLFLLVSAIASLELSAYVGWHCKCNDAEKSKLVEREEYCEKECADKGGVEFVIRKTEPLEIKDKEKSAAAQQENSVDFREVKEEPLETKTVGNF